MLVVGIVETGSQVRVEVIDDMNQGLTQDFINALCVSGEIGDMIEAEDEKILGRLNTYINEGSKQLSFVLVSRSKTGLDVGPDSTNGGANHAKRPAQLEDEMHAELVQAPSSWLNDVFHPGICAFCGKGPVLDEEADDGESITPQVATKLQRCKGCRNDYTTLHIS
jgi:hypothetical protein